MTRTTASYPSGAVYAEALQNSDRCFTDPDLRGGRVQMTQMGTPRAISGNFASVFSVVGTNGRRFAVKCFTRNVSDQHARYTAVSDELARLQRPWQVGFDYQPEGIVVQGRSFPVLKMEWIEARGLLPWLDAHLSDPQAVAAVAADFASAVTDLQSAGLAHGDLQHGNLLIDRSGKLRLIDYDGMFVPSLAAHGAAEKGHVNYQSPARSMQDYDASLDHFSAWLIYGSLLLLLQDPGLWAQFHVDGDEKLLFGRDDFVDCHALSTLTDIPGVDAALGSLRSCWTASSLAKIPPFDPRELPLPAELLEAYPETEPVPDTGGSRLSVPSSAGASRRRVQPASFSGGLLLSRICQSFLAVAVLALPALAVAPLVGMSMLAAALLALVVVGVPGYLAQPEVGAKRDSVGAVATRRAERRAAEARLAAATQELDRWRRNDQQQVAALTALQQAAAKREQAEIASATAGLQVERTRVVDALRQFEAEEKHRMRDALAQLRKAHITAALSRLSVRDAALPGIGDVLVHRLSLHGVVTAADIRMVEVFWSIGFSTWVTDVVNHSGRRAKIEGLGPAKGRTLMAWHKAVSARAKASAPRSLPAAELAAVRRAGDAERERLMGLEAELTRRLREEPAAIKRRHQAEQLRLRQQQGEVRRAAAAERRRLQPAYAAAEAAALRARRAEQEALRRREAYAGIGPHVFLLR
ncbi:MAG: hypothetical protein WD794_06500 [Mycobacteriales bacterium]